MRTTLTIENDVAVRIENLIRERRQPRKELINDLLRLGLDQIARKPEKRLFTTEGQALGKCRYDRIDDISEVLAVAEGDDFK